MYNKNHLDIIVVSTSSLPLARKIKDEYPAEVTIYCKEQVNEDSVSISSFDAITKELFPKSEAIVFIGAMGICVRTIAPYIKDKYTDPAVICLDSLGKHVVSVLSGHIGGANELAEDIAYLIGAEPVITTQSDNQGLWALDTFSEKFNWAVDVNNIDISSANQEKAGEEKKKAMNNCITAFVNSHPTALLLDVNTKETQYLEDTCPAHVDIYYRYTDIPWGNYELLITAGPYFYRETPVNSISFYPKVLHLGAGCKKGLKNDPGFITQIIKELTNNHFNPQAIADVSSINLKKDELLLTTFAKETLHCPFLTYPAEVLNTIEVPNPSSKVKDVASSSSVAEAAAIHSAGGGPLVMEKQKGKIGDTYNFTYALAIEKSVRRQGHVEIIGAGPGDPELISIRGRRMLEKADLILYAGSLVPKELTLCAKQKATVRSSADMNLEEQFGLMKKFYDKGKFVVRLHTGDPCIYGAIQEQMAFFDQYGMSYHITPGISSFQAAAAALKSQFTIPEKVQTIILTRGEGRTPMPEKEQLHKLAASRSTMCIFLSAGIADQVQQELLQSYPPSTPVAVCYKLTWKDERIYRGELKDLAKIVKDNNLTLTTLLIVGDAIDNREGLSRLYADEFKHLFRK